MRSRGSAENRLLKKKTGRRLLGGRRGRTVSIAAFSFTLNLLFAFYHGVLGVVHVSLWFITMCAYYAVLGVMRFSAVLYGRKTAPASSDDTEYFVMKLTGVLLVLLSLIIAGVNYISLSRNIVRRYDEIVMITIAAYTFYKISMAMVRGVKQRRDPSPLLAVLRRIGYAEAAASVLTLQRSMLVSFGTMSDTWAHTMNMLTGAAVCLFVLILGSSMILKRRTGGEMVGNIKAQKGE